MSSKSSSSLPKKQLSLFLKNYPLGENDYHLAVFRAVSEYCNAAASSSTQAVVGEAGGTKGSKVSASTVPATTAISPSFAVLYPGCHRHITPSLIFPYVKYVDIDSKVSELYSDPGALAWLETHKEYAAMPMTIEFQCANFESTSLAPKWASGRTDCFDLLISACAGIVSTPCQKYLKPGGYLLVSDAHYDARSAFVQKTAGRNAFSLVGVFNDETSKLETDEASLTGHFVTTKGDGKLTDQMVTENLHRANSKWPFKFKKSAMFYLFRKNEMDDVRADPQSRKKDAVTKATPSSSSGAQRGKRGREEAE